MNIKYQLSLKNNLVIKPTTGELADGSDCSFTLQPLTISQITDLEATYNHGNPFPVSLRELLFLAGQECYVLDYNIYDTQEEIQDDVRDTFSDYGRSITRPFFVIDVHRGSSQFLLVYLDEGVDDPVVYEAILGAGMNIPGYSWLIDSKTSLSSFVNTRIGYLQRGMNPY